MLTVLEQWPEDYETMYQTLQEFPQNNFDDFGATTTEEFTTEMIRRKEYGERLFIVRCNCFIIGYIGCRRVSSKKAIFHGICFAKEFHGKGLAKQALDEVIERIFDSGVTELYASFFAHNEKIYNLLKSLGAEDYGYKPKYTSQGGQAIDMRLVVFRQKGV